MKFKYNGITLRARIVTDPSTIITGKFMQRYSDTFMDNDSGWRPVSSESINHTVETFSDKRQFIEITSTFYNGS